MPLALIGLGSNVGDRAAQLDFAVRRLLETPRIEVVAQSRWIETQPVGGPSGQDAFLNGAVLVKTTLPPETLFEVLQQVENEAGRRREQHWGPRTLDLDLLLYGERVIQSPRLMIPHPRMAFRRFVLEPAAEVAGDILHPSTGWKVADLWRHLRESPRNVALGGPPIMAKPRVVRMLRDQLSAQVISGSQEQLVCELAKAKSLAQQREVALKFLNKWIERVGRDDPLGQSSWRLHDFALADLPALCRASSAELADEMAQQLDALSDSLPPPRLTLIVQPGGASLREQTITAETARLTRGPSLLIDCTNWEEAIDEALAAIRATE